MKVKILKGTNQIGGCITEITSDKGTKIIIDYGEDLSDDPKIKQEFPIKGLTSGRKKYKGVFITHSHGDHIGLISKIKKNIPVYIEETSAKIYEVSNAFCSGDTFNGKLETFKFNVPITIDDLTITPYRTDHSAYNSAMFLVENNGKKVLHLGDYRSNGYSNKIFYDNLKSIENVDLLITEGTNVTKDDVVNQTEEELTKEAIEIFKQYKQVFILQASTNLDRLKSFYNAADKVGKKVILDISTANILKAIDDSEFQYLKNDNVSVWVSNAYQKSKERFYARKEEGFYEKYIEPFEKKVRRFNPHTHGQYIMFVKTSSLDDIVHNLKNHRDNAIFIYSMWPGYKDEKRPNTERTRNFIAKLKELGIEEKYLHTSGHADIKTITEVKEIIKPKRTIGIHTEDNEKLKSIFGDGFEVITDNTEIII